MPAPFSSYFDISLEQTQPTIIIGMRVSGEHVTTTHMQYLPKLLRKELPTILHSTCFNEDDIPFYKEVVSTELGHLFEHILLEYLCIAKIGVGSEEAVFSGITRWDWSKDPYGMFHIELDITKEDMLFLTPALKKATLLFEKILLFPSAPIFTKAKINQSQIRMSE